MIPFTHKLGIWDLVMDWSEFLRSINILTQYTVLKGRENRLAKPIRALSITTPNTSFQAGVGLLRCYCA